MIPDIRTLAKQRYHPLRVSLSIPGWETIYTGGSII